LLHRVCLCIFLYLYYFDGWEYIVIFTQVLTMYQIFHVLIHNLYHSLTSPHSLIPGTVSVGIIFAFTYMCTHFLYQIYPPTHFPRHVSLPLISPLPSIPQQDLLCPPVFLFCRKKGKDKMKNMIFSLFEIKVATQGVSL
jgi:hypothetical protein